MDVSEYCGAQSFLEAQRVDYLQLKHSTLRAVTPWTASGLGRTLAGFGERYQGLLRVYGQPAIDIRVGFHVVSNRPIAASVVESVVDLSSGASPRHLAVASELVRHSGLPPSLIQPFFTRLFLTGREPSLRDQSNNLAMETRALLAGDDLDAVLRLKALITSKAGSDGKTNPTITATDVLQALHVGPERFLPAPSRLEPDPAAIQRRQEAQIGAAVVAATVPVLLMAPSGVGKSVLAMRLATFMPPGSATLVYDCFGNGEYRQLAHARHPHKIALVQMANELAIRGLCDPLLPTSTADSQDYMRGFVGRLAQAVVSVRSAVPDALVTLVVDAADNAQMAAQDVAAPPAFVRGLLRQPLPDGVRLVMLCRPERETLLEPPPDVVRIRLMTFLPEESAALLRHHYPNATDLEAAEFHRLSSANPRVQANALAAEPDLDSLLRSLGPSPTSVDTMIADQLKRALEKVRDDAGQGAAGIDTLCAALAALRPLIPLQVLAEVSGLTSDTVRSFAADFGRGRPLLIIGDAIQFRDEPVEEWFRKVYQADNRQLRQFVRQLQPLADTNAYAAATLPALMLACGQLTELIATALSKKRLPADSPMERREIEVERLQFALRASIRAERWLDAAKLAMKAGEEVAGAARQESLLRDNPDLIGLLFEPERLQELASRQVFASDGWMGGRYVREAALMSGAKELRGEALGKVRMADVWLAAWSRLGDDERDRDNIRDGHRADLMLAQLNLYGGDAACRQLMRWRPDTLWYDAALLLAHRLVDHGRFDDLEALITAAVACRAPPILGAIAVALDEVNRLLPEGAVAALISARPPRSKELRRYREPWLKDPGLSAVTALVEAALRHGISDCRSLSRRLGRTLPKRPPMDIGHQFGESRPSLLRAYALRAALSGQEVKLEDLAPPDVRAALRPNAANQNSQSAESFKARVGAVLPWWRLHARIQMAATTGTRLNFAMEIAAARTEMSRAIKSHDTDRYTVQDEIALVWFDLLCDSGPIGAELVEDFEVWARGLKRPLYIATWTRLARKAARSQHLSARGHGYVQRAVAGEAEAQGEPADSRIKSYVAAARAIFSIDRTEADEYLNKAVEVASKLGDDVQVRWSAVLSLANRSADQQCPDAELSYRLSRCAELCAEYSDDFDWKSTIERMSALSASSAIAIVSRWRDREVTRFDVALRSLVDALRDRNALDPILTCSLVGFRFGWPLAELLEEALDAAKNMSVKHALLRHVTRYASLDPQDLSLWPRLIAAANDHGLPTAELKHLQRKASEDARRGRAVHRDTAARRRRPVDWTSILRKLPVETGAEALEARDVAQSMPRPYQAGHFWAAVFSRVMVGNEAAFVRDVLASSRIDLYDVREFLSAIPEAWRQRLSVKTAMQRGVVELARRHCWAIRNRHYSSLPLSEAVRLSGLSEADILDSILGGVADDTDPAGADNLFNLVPILALRLDTSAAREGLRHGLSLIEASLEMDAGDGPWRTALEASHDTTVAMSGLIWGTLGSLNEGIRWQAAHVVRGLARLGQFQTVRALLDHAAFGAGPFASPSLPFYELHARQWLLLALARIARETPLALAGCETALHIQAKRDQSQVMIRRYAADALLALDEVGAARLTLEARSQLVNASGSRLPPLVLQQFGEGGSVDRYGPGRDDRAFVFDYELSRSMMEGLAQAFAISLPMLEELAESVILKDWALDASGYWNSDPRRGLPSLRHRGSGRGAPADSYSEYLTYHATLTAAGRLLESRRVRQYAIEREDEFARWLGSRSLTRPDGLWVSDRRDPIPSLSEPQQGIAADLWTWSVAATDFERIVGCNTARLVVCGRWYDPVPVGRERISVQSALVDAGTARALLVAAQTAEHAWDCILPSEGSDNEFELPPYVLRAWVSDNHLELHADRHDPWGAGMWYPPPTPAETVRTSLNLLAEDDQRRWRLPNQARPLFISEAWATIGSDDGMSSFVAEGERLMITRRSLQNVLRRLGMDLLIKVEIARELSKSRHSRDRNTEIVEYPDPYFRLFLFRQDGSLETFS